MNDDEIYNARIEAIAKRIKDLRIQAGYSSYEKFALEHNLDRKHYWRMESGQNISMKSLFKLLDIHNITIQTFFEDTHLPIG
ncbi:XRE family transcriptional regulator [Croceimicrobium sp.]|uniref:XRE family transcriptional regulator n=1 Tax=Croceimicrobium sp. TaxID=2828340 RepID=UPI003BAD56C5